jgi:hypothetical protein
LEFLISDGVNRSLWLYNISGRNMGLNLISSDYVLLI